MNSFQRVLFVALLTSFAGLLEARSSAEYLPADADLDPVFPSPESVLGWDVGEWHVSHDLLVTYMQQLAEASPRISLKQIGSTYEKRPLLQLIITSKSNQGKLEQLRQDHLAGRGPLVVWLGYSVHGDEPSGSNASLLAAYYLAASRSGFVDDLLEGTVVIMDPSINPDGLNRFASWANSNAGAVPVSDPVTRQHVQHWPEGRTNHYWFDLNRDWLPVVHPESRARVRQFHQWLPHVLTDHHEQDSYPGLFFQPGVPTRQNPLIPAGNLELTRALGAFHADMLNQKGQPYFTEDAYDDFFFGKGSTYPDINGGIGILYEQRAILGQALETSNGEETFSDAVSNHLDMSLSTLRGAWSLRDRLKQYRVDFGHHSRQRANAAGFQAWVIGDDGDTARAGALLEVFEQHDIEYHTLDENLSAGGFEFTSGQAWVIPVHQDRFPLLEAMMERRTTFDDSTFYDISAWTQPLAYNLPYATSKRTPQTVDNVQASHGLAPPADAVAWLVPWNQLNAPALLQNLLDAGAVVRTAIKPFSVQTRQGIRPYAAGTLVIPSSTLYGGDATTAHNLLTEAALEGLTVQAADTLLTATGPDLGSMHFAPVRPIRPLILGGEGVGSYDTGETWFLLDQRLGLSAPMVETYRFDGIPLSNYTHLLLADGDFSLVSDNKKAQITRWVQAGGVLVTVGKAAIWAEGLCFETDPALCSAATVVVVPSDESVIEPQPRRSYGDYASDHAQSVIGGAIVAGQLDSTHPLGFGFPRSDLPLMRRGTALLKPGLTPYSVPLRYSSDPLLAGFIGKDQLADLPGAPALVADRRGNGIVVRFANNPLFRGFWRGTERLYINALYFSQVVQPTDIPR